MTNNSSTATTNSGNSILCMNEYPLRVPLATLYTVIFVLGFAGNVLALWVFFFVHSKKNSVRVFLINIAFADLLLVVCLPFRISYHSQGDCWKLGPSLCTAVGTLFYMNMYISIVLLGMMSVDRYLKIHRSAGTRHRLLSTKRSVFLCTITWIASFTFSIPFLIRTSNTNPNATQTELPVRCFHYKTLNEQMRWKAYMNIFTVVVFWLAFICLMVSYGKIALKLIKNSQEKPDLPNALHYTRTARKSFFILFVFTFCFVPYHLVRVFYIKTQITDTSCFWRDVADKANEVALLFSALNSCLDPIMYFMFSSSVRKEVKRLVSRVFCVQDTAGFSGSSSTADMESAKTEREQSNVHFIAYVNDKPASKPSVDGRSVSYEAKETPSFSNVNTTGVVCRENRH